MIHYSPSTGGFYHAELHGDALPADAVQITARKHRDLLASQARGHVITSGPNGPVAQAPKLDREQLIESRVRRVKREARRRILAIASLERQSNDNAMLALGTPGTADYMAARERRHQIDAIRAASNEIESHLNDLSAAQLAAFDARNCGAWPEFA